MANSKREQNALLEQLKQIAAGLGETFAPFCEVVVHDLRDPAHTVVAVHNNLSGRELGDGPTEVGLARLADSDYPQIVANYPNRFADGRAVKSTSIGIRDSKGRYVAALCLNVDLTLVNALEHALHRFGATNPTANVTETLEPSGAQALRARIDAFAARLATTPRALRAEDRRALMRELKDAGGMEVRRAVEIVAGHLGVSRATVYNDLK